jgi:hypothetical protein
MTTTRTYTIKPSHTYTMPGVRERTKGKVK